MPDSDRVNLDIWKQSEIKRERHSNNAGVAEASSVTVLLLQGVVEQPDDHPELQIDCIESVLAAMVDEGAMTAADVERVHGALCAVYLKTADSPLILSKASTARDRILAQNNEIGQQDVGALNTANRVQAGHSSVANLC